MSSRTNALALFVADGTWHAEHFGPKAAEVQDLFGTTILPTAFLAGAPAEEVLAEIQARNPDHIVYLAEPES